MLETDDDGRLNGLIDQFTAMVGKAVPPAHPRTKVIGQVDRSEHALSWHWYLPPELPEQERKRLDGEQTAYLMSEVWPETPMTTFGGRSPLQVARSGKDATLLRGVVLAMRAIGRRVGRPDGLGRVPGAARAPGRAADRSRDGGDRRGPLGRLAMVPLDRLDDDRLLALYLRAHEWGLLELMPRAAREIIGRPRPGDLGRRSSRSSSTATLPSRRPRKGDRDAAMEWVRRGRQAEPPARRATAAPHWDMFELQLRTRLDRPEEWVPDLAAILERYRQDNERVDDDHARAAGDGAGPPDLATRPAGRADARHAACSSSSWRVYGPKVTTRLRLPRRLGDPRRDLDAGFGGQGLPAIWTPGSETQAGGAGARSRGSSCRAEADRRDRSRAPLDRGRRLMSATSTQDASLSLVHEGWNHLMSQRPLAAWGTWQRALRIDPESAAARQAIETLESAPDLPLAARQVYRFRKPATPRPAVGLEPGDPQRPQAELADAADAFGRLTDEAPEDAEAWFNKGLCLAWLGQDRQAIECLDRGRRPGRRSRPEPGRGRLGPGRDPPPGRGRGEPLRRPALRLQLRLEPPTTPPGWSPRSPRSGGSRPRTTPPGPAHSLADLEVLEWLDRPFPTASAVAGEADLPRLLATDLHHAGDAAADQPPRGDARAGRGEAREDARGGRSGRSNAWRPPCPSRSSTPTSGPRPARGARSRALARLARDRGAYYENHWIHRPASGPRRALAPGRGPRTRGGAIPGPGQARGRDPVARTARQPLQRRSSCTRAIPSIASEAGSASRWRTPIRSIPSTSRALAPRAQRARARRARRRAASRGLRVGRRLPRRRPDHPVRRRLAPQALRLSPDRPDDGLRCRSSARRCSGATPRKPSSCSTRPGPRVRIQP